MIAARSLSLSLSFFLSVPLSLCKLGFLFVYTCHERTVEYRNRRVKSVSKTPCVYVCVKEKEKEREQDPSKNTFFLAVSDGEEREEREERERERERKARAEKGRESEEERKRWMDRGGRNLIYLWRPCILISHLAMSCASY